MIDPKKTLEYTLLLTPIAYVSFHIFCTIAYRVLDWAILKNGGPADDSAEIEAWRRRNE